MAIKKHANDVFHKLSVSNIVLIVPLKAYIPYPKAAKEDRTLAKAVPSMPRFRYANVT